MIPNRKAKVLIVENDGELAEAIDRHLGGAGYQVFMAGNGILGLQMLYADHPDVILLDIAMPGMNGWDICRHVREYTNAPIIMLAARGQEDDKVRGLKIVKNFLSVNNKGKLK